MFDATMIRNLSPVDKRMYDAGFLGTDMSGVYQAEPLGHAAGEP